MNQVEKSIRSCLERGDKAFVPYIMAGDGGLDTLREKVLFLQEKGATAIEIGIPFSDPVADGETIQQAGERALAEGVTLRSVLRTLQSFKQEVNPEMPLLIMSYLNPILAFGVDEFVQSLQVSGVSGLIIPDLPLEESELLNETLATNHIALIQLVSLTSDQKRMAAISGQSSGFIYAVTVNGITGARQGFDEALAEHLMNLKSISSVPVLTGFGISTPAQVEELSDYTDGVIVGSAIVEAFHNGDADRISRLIKASKGKQTADH
ncbi:tryptophan synthase subunit alpha [Sporosarcina sp. Te-1]|uniref:tryptophan synthase subunit alpha n=1 Tax=Sporosarcina sp. Te-1 TaxID=2818390 RepID=UPI001A9DD4DA|nr:tryptophan synthase subunit alpha [Sporosarcina sp. Te-1]QTD40009.1 tryptophan synthase subunit alpha [Sporosarcina sp. Te-1]